MPTVKSAAWCLGSGGLGAEMVGLCGSAQQATPSPGAPLQAPHLQRSPSQPSFQVLPREPGAQRPGVGRSLQVWNLSMRRGLRRQGCSGEDEGGDADESEEEMLSDASPWTYSSSSDNCEPDGPRLLPSPVTHALKEGEIALDTAAAPTSLARPPSSAPAVSPGASLPVEGGVELELNRTPQVAQQSEPLASPGSQAQSSLVVAWDKDHAQIGPKRIRKAAKKELLPCDFPGCGRIFSNRQYLNHHKKYQHIHQKSFSCPEPACGKSFNFKKHLKEHVKLHSDTRDYICEFCARSFRTSSNLVIHQRIHTGEKPLQCEICGFTCRQKASLNWHRRKHAETAATLRFPCKVCGKRFEKPDSVAAHCSKSHPAVLLATSEQLDQVEPCPSISAPALLGSRDECRPPQVLQALTLLPKQ
ncbi:zinc finger protein 692 isoform X5 [Phyllostomus discolor]|uniref:Zinc finger protein 692 n=2 Tax=Phyllostomus discolor TaxID=89673 RepID=A0A7E6ECM7_9CHIR|nr:zinc finger protein 692 isoform X5 [Phyllostomus discolor]